jgi:hypothetical protein
MMLGNVSNTFIMPQVRAVIACRVTPLQKAEIVRPTSAPGPRPPLPHLSAPEQLLRQQVRKFKQQLAECAPLPVPVSRVLRVPCVA